MPWRRPSWPTIFRRPRRRDLIYLSGGLVVGILAQAVLGGIVVYTKLNPYLVMVHFFATMRPAGQRRRPGPPLHRLDYGPGSARLLVPRPLLRLHYGVLVVLGLRHCRRHGDHRGRSARRRSSGQLVAKRIPIALRDMAELHSSLAMLLVGLTIGLVVGLHMADVPERVRRAGRVLLVVMVAQAAVGYTQYFTHLPALLVEVHLLGVTVLVIGAVQCFLACTFHPAEVEVGTRPDSGAGSEAQPAAAGTPIGAR